MMALPPRTFRDYRNSYGFVQLLKRWVNRLAGAGLYPIGEANGSGDDVLNFALVGCGRIAKRHSELLGNAPDPGRHAGGGLRHRP